MSDLALFGGSPVRSEPFPPYYTIGDEERAAVNQLFDEKYLLSGFIARAGDHFLGGKYVKELERLFTEYFGVKHAVAFNSATTALQAAVAAAGIGPGDEVITSPYTMSATPTAILLNNAVPVFADIDETTYCISAETIEPLINERTKAIMTVNIFGGCADYDPILELAEKHNLKIIEDNAQAPAGKYKGKYTATIGNMGIFSLNIHKTIQCGEGGVLITNDDKEALRAQLVRNHGEVVVDDLAEEEFEPVLGSNYRLSELHAAIGVEQFKKLDKLNQVRVDLADYLNEQLERFDWLVAPPQLPDWKHVYYIYPFRILPEKAGITRKQFVAAMKAEGFPLVEGYQKPLYLLPLYQKKQPFPGSQFPLVSSEFPTDVSYEKGICPFVEKMYFEELMHSTICQVPQTKEDIDQFIQAIEKIEQNIDQLKEHDA